VVLVWDGYAAHVIGIDVCATDNIFVRVLNNRCKLHTLASRSASSKNPGDIRGAPFIFGAGRGVALT